MAFVNQNNGEAARTQAISMFAACAMHPDTGNRALAWLGELQAEGTAIRRRVERRRLRFLSQATIGREAVEVQIHDLSPSGLLIETSAHMSVGDVLDVDMPETEPVSAIVVWSRDNLYGCKFVTPVPEMVISAALIKSVPLERDADLPADMFADALDGIEKEAGGWPGYVRILILMALGVVAWAILYWFGSVLLHLFAIVTAKVTAEVSQLSAYRLVGLLANKR